MAAIDKDTEDTAYLESLGYTQELKRDMTFLGSVGTTLGCMQPLLSAGVFQLGMLYGGPAVVVYGFLGVFLFATPMALSMAEISSPFVTAGGPYYWSGALAGRLGKLPPFVIGWMILVAFFGGGCSIGLQGMYQVTAMRMIYWYGFDTATTSPASSQLGQFGIAVAVIAFGGLVAMLPMRYLNKLAIASFWWLIFGAAVLIIAVPATAPSGPTPGDGYRSDTAFVFRSDPNLLSEATAINGVFQYANLGSRTNSNAFTVCNGLLMAQYLILVFDVPGHMAEETRNASRAVPRSILTAFFLGSMINFALLLSYLYSVTHVKNASVPGFGITGSCNTNNGDLPPWSTNNFHTTSEDGTGFLPNNGTPLNKFDGGCVLSNGWPFTYFPVGNIYYDAFAARYPRCTPEQAFGPNLNKPCVPVHLGGCCDIMGGGGIHFAMNSASALVATTSDGAVITTEAQTPTQMFLYPAPQGIAPTEYGRNVAIFMCFIIFMGTMFTSVLNFVAASRFIYSFARDGGFPPPFNKYLATVHPKTGAPLWAIMLFLTGCVLFTVAWTNKSPVVSFNAVSGINSIGFLMVYGTPSLLRFTTALKTFKPAPGFNLGRLSIPIAVLGASYGAFSVATISLPNFWPVEGHPNNANYAPIAFGAVLVFAFGLYPVATRSKWWIYRGPALIAQATRHKEAIGDEQSVRAPNKQAAEDAAAPIAAEAAPEAA